jgi:hypothetical protein
MLRLSKYRIVGPPAPDSARVMLFMNPSAPARLGGPVQYKTCEVFESICRRPGGDDGARASMTALIASRSDPFTRMVVDDSLQECGGAITLDVSVGRARDIAGMMGAALVCVEGVYCDMLTRDLWTDVHIFGTPDDEMGALIRSWRMRQI